ncbi:unnamed protein product [Effrenium voratum]|uniref:Uncharacterized protein n=1 Tax=Effrenium voratum TaxID=2562239 RepID=A0AA36NLI3_9DINO|nr:unnamed protein product [Effrenium voratum]
MAGRWNAAQCLDGRRSRKHRCRALPDFSLARRGRAGKAAKGSPPRDQVAVPGNGEWRAEASSCKRALRAPFGSVASSCKKTGHAPGAQAGRLTSDELCVASASQPPAADAGLIERVAKGDALPDQEVAGPRLSSAPGRRIRSRLKTRP